jgi:predicted ribosome quality control (RQC) complex YloA/Tae2 family protein
MKPNLTKLSLTILILFTFSLEAYSQKPSFEKPSIEKPEPQNEENKKQEKPKFFLKKMGYPALDEMLNGGIFSKFSKPSAQEVQAKLTERQQLKEEISQLAEKAKNSPSHEREAIEQRMRTLEQKLRETDKKLDEYEKQGQKIYGRMTPEQRVKFKTQVAENKRKHDEVKSLFNGPQNGSDETGMDSPTHSANIQEKQMKPSEPQNLRAPQE